MYSLSKCKKLPFSKQLYIAKPRFALIVCYVICPYYRPVLMIIKGYFIFFLIRVIVKIRQASCPLHIL